MAPGLQRPPASGRAIRGGGRRRRAGVLGPRQASPREQSMAWELWFYLARGIEGLFMAPSRAGEGAASPATAVVPEALSIERRRSWPGMLPSEPLRLRRPPSGRRVRLAWPRGARWAGSGASRQAGDRARGQLALSWCGQWRRAGGQIIRASRKRQRRKSPEGTIGERRRGRGRGFAPCRAGSRAPAGRRQLRRRRGDQGHAIFPALPGSSAPGAGVAPLGARAV
jgi:hypothetical protein